LPNLPVTFTLGTLTSDLCINKIRDPWKSDHKRRMLLAVVNNNQFA